jgi:hypothetical protein
MNFSRQWTAALLVSAGGVIAMMSAYIHFQCNRDGRESLGDKREWSIMQAIEAQNRNRSVSDLEFVDTAGYQIVGIPNIARKTTWVMLNPKNPPYYKQFGVTYVLTKEQLQRIILNRHAISTVAEGLASHREE